MKDARPPFATVRDALRAVLASIALLPSAGCQTTVEPIRGGGERPPSAASARSPSGRPPALPEFEPVEASSAGAIAIHAIVPRGTIPYDGVTLPLVSPSGTRIATQGGFAPDWSTTLARPGASIPERTRVEIYALDLAQTSGNPRLVAVVQESVILGRACDDRGFLVESPREDGSRWIGRAAWETGEVEWLVDEKGSVAAFATLAHDGRLAYARRSLGEFDEFDEFGELAAREESQTLFDLVVRDPSGLDEWVLAARADSWLMPTFDGDHLFALRLEGRSLELVSMRAGSRDEMLRTIRRTLLASDGADLRTAYQTLAATIPVPIGAARAPSIGFFHPVRLRAAVWQPPAPPWLFGVSSFAAVPDRDAPEFYFVVGSENLTRRLPGDARVRSSVLEGTQVVRVTASEEIPYVLFAPDPDNGLLAITVMRPLATGTGVKGR